MSTLKLPIGVIENIDRARKQCLWRGTDQQKKGGNLAAWEMVTKPKSKGGVGAINLRVQNEGLLVKQLHKFYSRHDTPWVHLVWDTYYSDKVPHASREVGSFWWKDILGLNEPYRSGAVCKVGNGTSMLFWKDNWMGEPLETQFPTLASFSLQCLISVKGIQEARDLASIFSLPLSEQAHNELRELQNLLIDSTYDEAVIDEWSIPGGFSVTKFYKQRHEYLQVSAVFGKMWKSKCTMRTKFFFWLLLVDRLNTKDMLHRKNMLAARERNCIMCGTGGIEDVDHLFFSCPFAQQCWSHLHVHWSLDLPGKIGSCKVATPGEDLSFLKSA